MSGTLHHNTTSAPAAQPRQVLLIDDSRADAAAVERLLRDGYAVRRAPTLKDAADQLTLQSFDVVLLDLWIPDHEPQEVLRSVLKVTANVPVLVLTGKDDHKLAYQCLDAGAQDFIRKEELDEIPLTRVLDHAISRHRAAEMSRRLELAERQAALGAIAAYVTHEINNLSTVLMGNSELARGTISGILPNVEAKERAALAGVDKALASQISVIERMSAILHELHIFSRGRAPRASSPSDPRDVIERTLSLVGNHLSQTAVVTVTCDECPLVVADEVQLGQVLLSLFRNAAAGIGEGPREGHRIEIRAEAVRDAVRISVTDTGKGIPEEELPRLFRPFLGAERGGDRSGGLGLAICAEIVASFGGRMDVLSELGRGSTFTVTVPAAEGRAETLPPAPAVEGRERRVLVIDDDSEVLEQMAALLAVHHRVVAVVGGREALSFLETDSEFDAILCDLMMPDVDGVAVLDGIEAMSAELAGRFAIVTGGAFTDRAAELVDSGDVAVLRKPFRASGLFEMVERLASHERTV